MIYLYNNLPKQDLNNDNINRHDNMDRAYSTARLIGYQVPSSLT